jgi:predicted RNA methylase
MKIRLPNTHRLHTLRMENDAAGFAMAEMSPRFEALRTRHEDGTAPQAISAPQLFQTPPEIAARLAASLKLAPAARVLEPSAGLGRLVDALKPYQPAEIVAVEHAADCARVLFQRGDVSLRQRDFLAVQRAELGTFDAVAMNPPFHMRADIRHIQHAIKFLKPGGRLAGICMDTPHREKALRRMCSEWEALPAETFAKEGTRVPTIRFLICT